MEKQILIIGYGNTLRGDDGVGYRAAEMLAENATVCAVAEVLACRMLTPELAEKISRVQRVIFLDADSRLPTGKIEHRELVPDYHINPGLSHHLNPTQLLGFASVLYDKMPAKAEGLFMGATSFDFVDCLSPEVEAGLRVLMGEIEAIICNAA